MACIARQHGKPASATNAGLSKSAVGVQQTLKRFGAESCKPKASIFTAFRLQGTRRAKGRLCQAITGGKKSATANPYGRGEPVTKRRMPSTFAPEPFSPFLNSESPFLCKLHSYFSRMQKAGFHFFCSAG